MSKDNSATLTKELFESLSKIRLTLVSGVAGTTSKQVMLQDLQKKVAQLGASISAEEEYEEIMKRYDEMISALDTAGITGIISQDEMHDYYKKVDNIWSAIEKDNK